jgi:hypothetical protein
MVSKYTEALKIIEEVITSSVDEEGKQRIRDHLKYDRVLRATMVLKGIKDMLDNGAESDGIDKVLEERYGLTPFELVSMSEAVKLGDELGQIGMGYFAISMILVLGMEFGKLEPHSDEMLEEADKAYEKMRTENRMRRRAQTGRSPSGGERSEPSVDSSLPVMPPNERPV